MSNEIRFSVKEGFPSTVKVAVQVKEGKNWCAAGQLEFDIEQWRFLRVVLLSGADRVLGRVTGNIEVNEDRDVKRSIHGG